MMICIAGKNEIAVECTRFLIEKNLVSKDNLLVCFNLTDDGFDTFQPSFKRFANNNGLQECLVKDIVHIKDLVLISLEYDRLIPFKKFISKNIFNTHFSLLPKYKGMYTSIWPIINGEKFSGVTLHKIDSGIDTGDIIDQMKVKIDITDTCRDLYFKKMNAGIKLFKKNVEKLINGKFESIPQPYEDSTYYSKKSIDFENIIIDCNKTSLEIHNQLRAYIFSEYQLPSLKNNLIYKSVIKDETIGEKVFIENDEKIILSGIDGFKIEAYKK
jgi:methionyl-tRNA formyltransferase